MSEKRDHETLHVRSGIKINNVIKANFLIMMMRGIPVSDNMNEFLQSMKKVVKLCSHEGCDNQIQKNGVCIQDGAKVQLSSQKGCGSNVVDNGVCIQCGRNVIISESVSSMARKRESANTRCAAIRAKKKESVLSMEQIINDTRNLGAID